LALLGPVSELKKTRMKENINFIEASPFINIASGILLKYIFDKCAEDMEKFKITLEKEKETLLIPLLSKALETGKKNPIISDPYSVELVEQIEYDYDSLNIPKKTRITICIRAKRFDDYVKQFLDMHPQGTVVYMGCGLDARFSRVDNGKIEWYDLDFPDVIELRRKFYPETDRYHLIPSSVTDPQWIGNLKDKKRPVLFIAEGLFMYLKEEEVKALILKLRKTFPGSLLIFDAFSAYAARNMGLHPSISKTGANVYWGIDNSRKIEKWNNGISLMEEWYFTQSEEIQKLDAGYRIMFKIAGMFLAAKKAHRILVFKLG
jgi:O-methyltransferase involved in polyketide biosynthesis